MSNCPCCGNSLLRHVRHGNVYWFCQSCWAEMPNFDLMRMINPHRKLQQHLSPLERENQGKLAEVTCV
ncbi:MAG: hypothetical protein IGR93_17345 [Hydrococcus sp. C42_A2020_068]|uniref:hypothetical protein n=1 Tax=Pleurocapsa sp. PCC 7327 TaxID=118163 RepID=UPI00029FC53D|nr:hypothetical protein [Pleurocapsa sp. PCC 7327]AFY75935.1 hypothetical protein Ple7327_0484 [Pleurocapsa sp. PCC 7327]MBF2021806.1 hypothetical protein [Hydrococcus sp. C42_A2020_068]